MTLPAESTRSTRSVVPPLLPCASTESTIDRPNFTFTTPTRALPFANDARQLDDRSLRRGVGGRLRRRHPVGPRRLPPAFVALDEVRRRRRRHRVVAVFIGDHDFGDVELGEQLVQVAVSAFSSTCCDRVALNICSSCRRSSGFGRPLRARDLGALLGRGDDDGDDAISSTCRVRSASTRSTSCSESDAALTMRASSSPAIDLLEDEQAGVRDDAEDENGRRCRRDSGSATAATAPTACRRRECADREDARTGTGVHRPLDSAVTPTHDRTDRSNPGRRAGRLRSCRHRAEMAGALGGARDEPHRPRLPACGRSTP